MKKLFLLLLTLCLFACQPSTAFTYVIKDQSGHSVKIVPIYLDAKWDNDEVAAIEVAVNDWNASLGGEIRLEVEDRHYAIGSTADPGLMLIKVSEKQEIARRADVLIALGWFDRGSGRRIYMVRDRLIARGKDVETPWEMPDVSAVVRHELGHALGSRHLEGYGLMAPRYDRDEYQCIDKPAIDAIAAYQHVSSEKMKWCQH